MMKYFIAYGVTALVFFTIDFVWLSQVATRFYFSRIGHLLMDKPNMLAAAMFYFVYIAGIVFFSVNPALKTGSVTTALVSGALFGFFAYATYDMTNYATLKNWPLSVVIVDISWGVVLTSASATLGFLGTQWLTRG